MMKYKRHVVYQRLFAALLLATAFLQYPAMAAEQPSDDSVTHFVKEALKHDDRVDTTRITVSVDRGIVKLVGEVNNLATKNFADQEAKKINGVLGVLNELYVKRGPRADSDIAHTIRRRILSNADIRSDGIAVAVVNGKATLSGTVGTYSEGQQAAILAAETAGVTDVDNNLTWEWRRSRSDEAIRKDIEAAFGRDVYLSGRGIKISVLDGNVSLSGSLGTAYEKDKAAHDALAIANVKSVDNKLRVVWWKNRGERKHTAHRTNAELKQAVIDELEQDHRISSDKIDVTASYGRVTLDGSVRSHYQRRTAEQDIKDVIGVSWVTDNLFAEVDERADRQIKADVELNLGTDSTLEGFDLDTKISNGVVTLSGEVHSLYEKMHARSVASDVKGVRKVINTISVHYSAPKSDSELAKDVSSRLTWNWTTWPVHNDIGVKVRNGIATLTGDVDNWNERNVAASVAFSTSGIWRVDNRISVNGYSYPWSDWYFEGPYVYDPYYDADEWPYVYDYYWREW